MFDLLLHRILEVPEIAAQSLEKLLDRFGQLYKFHGTITYWQSNPSFFLLSFPLLPLPPPPPSSPSLLALPPPPPSSHPDHPISFLYTTLHYYERTLVDRPSWKRKLVSAVISEEQCHVVCILNIHWFILYVQVLSKAYIPLTGK